MSFIQIALKKYVQETLQETLKNAFKTSSGGRLRATVIAEFPKRLVSYPAIIIGDVVGDTYRFIGEPFLYDDRASNATLIPGATHTITNTIERGGFFNVQVDFFVAAQTTSQRRNALDLVTIFLRDVRRGALEEDGLTLIDIGIGRGRTERLGNDYVYFDTLRARYFVKGWEEDLSRTRGDFDIVQSIIKEMIITEDGSCQFF